MSVVPVIMSFEDTTSPTLDDRRVWYTMVLNAALHFERVMGIAPRIISQLGGMADVVYAPERVPGVPGADIYSDPTAFIAVDRILRSQNRDPARQAQMVCVFGTGSGGRAGPKPFRGWWAPSDGALGVIGQAHLIHTKRLRSPNYSPWTKRERQIYFLHLWTVIHEMGHFGPVPDQIGGPVDETMMAYNLGFGNPHSYQYFLGRPEEVTGSDGTRKFIYKSFKTVGWQEDELRTFEASPIWDLRKTGRRIHIYPEDRAKLLLMDQEHYPPHQMVGHGLAVQEYLFV
jgi:hypothetical protein